MDKLTTVISVRGRKREELEADPDFLYVGRAVRFTEWNNRSIFANPFSAKEYPDAAEVFRIMLTREIDGLKTDAPGYVHHFKAMIPHLSETRGKTLGCWCGEWKPGDPEIPCHAVVLAKLANEASEKIANALEELRKRAMSDAEIDELLK